MTRKLAAVATIIVIIHAVVVSLHALAHGKLEIQAARLDTMYIVLVIIIAPLAAGVLIWTKYRRIGLIVLGLSMLGAFVYGVYNHFFSPGIDNVANVAEGRWGMVFGLTAILLAVVEAVGCAAAVLTVRAQPSGNVEVPGQ